MAATTPLEGVLVELARYPKTEETLLLLEHFEEARRYYLGGQQAEFDWELEMARSSLDQISDEGMREFTRRAIEEASQAVVSPAQGRAPAGV